MRKFILKRYKKQFLEKLKKEKKKKNKNTPTIKALVGLVDIIRGGVCIYQSKDSDSQRKCL